MVPTLCATRSGVRLSTKHAANRPHSPIARSVAVAVLETIAAQVSTTLIEMRKELHDFRLKIRGDVRDLRTEMRAEARDLRRIHDRVFRITFGAIITTTLALAALIAHVAHWLQALQRQRALPLRLSAPVGHRRHLAVAEPQA